MLKLPVVKELKHILFRKIFLRDGKKVNQSYVMILFNYFDISTVNRTKQSIGIVRWDIKVVTCLLIDLNRNWNNNIHLFKLNVPD